MSGHLSRGQGPRSPFPLSRPQQLKLVIPHASWHSQSLSLDQLLLLNGPATRWHLGGRAQWGWAVDLEPP